MDSSATQKAWGDVPNPDWEDKVFSAIIDMATDPFLEVAHYRLPIIHRYADQSINLVEEHKVRKKEVLYSKGNDFFMTLFARRGKKDETVVGIQQKFKATVPQGTIVSFKPDFHYRWSSKKDGIVTITHNLKGIKKEIIYEGIDRLVTECGMFMFMYTDEGGSVIKDDEIGDLPF